MERVTGLGGVFFKCQDVKKQQAWYAQHLGVKGGQYGVNFKWRDFDDPSREGYTVWSPFPADTTYFGPSGQPFMINYRVADLDKLLAALRAEGVAVEDTVEEYEFGRFAWVTDPEGNRIELWEPKGPAPD